MTRTRAACRTPAPRRWIRGWVGVLALWIAAAAPVQAQDAATLRAKHDSLREALASNPFQRPLVLESTQNASDLRGDVYAVIDQPFGVVAPELQRIDHWCDLLIVHLNVKYCSTEGKPPAQTLNLAVGRKFDQPLDDTYRLAFAFATPVATADYLKVQMSAEEGPMSTRNYRLAFEAVPLDARRSFVHMSYAYAYGFAARLAMQGYLATIGRDKVGFSVVGKTAEGKPVYIDGVRGVVERNTMRYYLAIEAYLGALATPPAQQVDKRLRDWFDATERHARQLHEMDRDEYLAMKRSEIQRQQDAAKAAKPN